MAIGTDTAPELTAEQVARILTAPLEHRSAFLAMGPRIYDTAGPLRIPAAPAGLPLTGPTTDPDDALPFTGENELIPERDYEFGEVTLLPSTMESIKVLTRFSNELARQSVVNLETALRDRLVRDVAARVDVALFGDGGDGTTTPRGLFAYEGTQSIDTAGAEITLDTLLDAQGLALAAAVDERTLRVVLNPTDYMALRKAKDGDDRYMLEPDARRGSDVPTLLGMPVTVTPRVAAGTAAVLDPSAIAVARDLAPSVKVLSERYADYDQQAVRVVARYDAAPTTPGAIVLVRDES